MNCSPIRLAKTSTRWAAACVVLVSTAACTGSIENDSRTPRGPVDVDGDGIPDPVSGPGGTAGNGAPGSDPNGSNPGAGPAPAATVELPGPTLRRLTSAQYRNSVHDLLGVEADVSALTAIPPLSGLQAIGASSVALPEVDLEALEGLAQTLSAQVFGDTTAREKLVGCDPAQAACAEGFVTAFGRRAFRRPLTADEAARYTALLRTATQMTGDAWLGLQVAGSAFLQSPAFLYREELGTPDPSNAARRVLTDYEVGARLSFFLWNTTPDAALLDAAERGELGTAAGLLAQAQRLLQSPRAAQAIEELFADYLRLDALDALVKLPEVFPAATDTLPAAMKQETLLSLRTLLFEREGDFRDVFTTTTTFVDAELAELYELSRFSGSAFAEVTLPADGARAGLLTQASFLSAYAHPSRTSPTRRGKFIRENLLCQAVPAPPPDVNTTLPDTSDARTLREKLTRHREDPACSGCHTLMDPLGLALEHFDGIGAYRATENGVTIDASGELDGVRFDDARGLGEALAADPAVAACFARTLLRYARGTLENRSEDPIVTALAAAFAGTDYRMPELMLSVVSDAAFRYVGGLQ